MRRIRNVRISANKIPPTKFEQVPPNEEKQISEIAELTIKLLKQRYPNKKPLRNVHPKDHGCVTSTFKVNDDIPQKFRQGIFRKPGKSYESIIRFSNATAAVQDDVAADGQASSRGFAIKVYDVKGDMLIAEPGRNSQDFLMINLPVFAIADVADYLELTKVQFKNKDNILPFFAGAPNLPPNKLKSLQIVGAIGQTQISNPVNSNYFSAAPFLMGSEQVVKFSVSPRTMQNTPMPSNPSPNYLREALTKTLDESSGSEVVFDFRVQLRANESQKIEDATDEWSETDSPFVNIATITIPTQNFNTPERMKQCTDLVLTPWHGLKAHQPLGGINRLRKAAYLASSIFRSDKRSSKRDQIRR